MIQLHRKFHILIVGILIIEIMITMVIIFLKVIKVTIGNMLIMVTRLLWFLWLLIIVNMAIMDC